jgi:hypothetical protein
MLSIENFKNARWQDIYAFFISGEPPLVIKLLIINTIFMVILIMRKSRGGNQSSRTSNTMQALLIIANGFVMFQSQLLPSGSFLNNLNVSKDIVHKIYEGFTS